MKLVELLAHLDLYERFDEMLKAVFIGPSWRFAVPRHRGGSGYQIEILLRRHGVKVWGRNFDHDHLFFRVKVRQANWAEYLLWRHGITVLSRPFNPRNRTRDAVSPEATRPASQPTAAQRSTWLDDLLSLFF